MAININIPSQFREYNNFASFPATGDSKVVYVAKNNNKIYRWDGAAYVELSTDAASSWGSIQGTLSNQTDLQTALNAKVDTNSAITGATKTKVTYDSKGLVTSGADATTADIADSTNKRYVTDADLTTLSNTSGTNTGDNATNSQYSGLATSKQDTLVSGTNIKTVNSTSLLGSGDVSVGVTSVTGTSPISSSGGATPDISIATANTTTTGALTSTDWNTFNNKQNALTLTTTGTSGAATLIGATLNIPQYSGGGLVGVHALNINSGSAIHGQLTYAALSSTAQVANRMFLYPFIPAKSFTTTNLFIVVQTAVSSSLGKILIYSDVSGNPSVLLYESASLDCSTTGTKTATTSFSFTAGTTYWLAFWGNSTQTLYTMPTSSMLTFRNSGAVPSPYVGITGTYTYGSAPSTITTNTIINSACPFIGITPA